MNVQEFYTLVDAWKKAYAQYSLYQCFSECFEQWFNVINADHDQDVNLQIIKFIAAQKTLLSKHNELDENARRELYELEVGAFRYPLFETMYNLAINLNHWMKLEGTTRKTIADRLELIGLPYKPVDLDLVRRDLLKLKERIEGPRDIAAAIADVLQHFVNQPAKKVFERSEKWATYLKVLEQIKPIDGIGWQSYMDVGDSSISLELGSLISDIGNWSEEVGEQRTDYLFNNMLTELPDPFWMAFGLTSDVMRQYESFTSRIKRLIECLKQVPPPTKTTQKTTSGKKDRKPRAMNVQAVDCCRRYKADKGKIPMKTIVSDYVSECGGSVASILRVLNDNPEQWRNTDTEAT